MTGRSRTPRPRGNKWRWRKRLTGLIQPHNGWEWKQFLTIEQPFCFSTIATDLSRTDIHPPLYFWLLHIFLLLFGMHAWTGPLLNTCLAVGTAMALFFFARTCFSKTIPALAASVLWFACPTAISASQVARQYDLLTLLSVLLITQCVWVCRSGQVLSWRTGLAILVLCILGPMTHLHFGLVMAGCGVFMLLHLTGMGIKKFLAIIALMGLGVCLFYVIHPGILQSINQGKVQLQTYSVENLKDRFTVCWFALGQFFGIVVPFHALAYLFAIATVFLFVLSGLHRWGVVLLKKIDIRSSEYPALFYFIWNWGFNVALYLTFFSPFHAMGDRYLSLVWPFMACICVLFLRYVPQNSHLLMVVLAGILLFFSTLYPLNTERPFFPNADPMPDLQKHEALLVDTHSRGFMLQLIYAVPEDKMVFVGSQQEILANPDAVLSQPFKSFCYYNLNAYGNNHEQARQVIDILSQHYFIRNKLSKVWNHGQLLICARRFKETP